MAPAAYPTHAVSSRSGTMIGGTNFPSSAQIRCKAVFRDSCQSASCPILETRIPNWPSWLVAIRALLSVHIYLLKIGTYRGWRPFQRFWPQEPSSSTRPTGHFVSFFFLSQPIRRPAKRSLSFSLLFALTLQIFE